MLAAMLAMAGCGSEERRGADATYVAERDATRQAIGSVTAMSPPATQPATPPERTQTTSPTMASATVTPRKTPTVAATTPPTPSATRTVTATAERTAEPTVEQTAEATQETTPEPEPTPEQPAETIHVVVEGETLIGIANQYGVSANEIATLNELVDSNLLTIGQELRIPVPPQQ